MRFCGSSRMCSVLSYKWFFFFIGTLKFFLYASLILWPESLRNNCTLQWEQIQIFPIYVSNLLVLVCWRNTHIIDGVLSLIVVYFMWLEIVRFWFEVFFSPFWLTFHSFCWWWFYPLTAFSPMMEHTITWAKTSN